MNPFAPIGKQIEYFGALPAPEESRASRDTGGTGRALAGGRISFDKFDDGLSTWRTLVAPAEPEQSWRIQDLDAKSLERASPAKLMELLADLSPDVSRALWDFLRMCNPGWEATALRPGTEEQDEAAQATLDAFLQAMNRQGDPLYVSAFELAISRLYIAAFLRGAFFAELVLDRTGRVPLLLATPDPVGARFRRKDDADRGWVWQLCQWQGGTLVDLDRPTVDYVPIDPFPGSPYGRPLASAALFTAVFALAMLHDLRRVVQQQGYPRIDLAIQLERLLAVMPAGTDRDPKALQEWVDAIITEIKAAYKDLQPDEAYVHTDVVAVNRPVGAVDSSSLGAVDGLIKALERMMVRALKTMPLMMGLDMSASEGQSNRQWEVYAAGIKALQHLCETLLERLLGLALQAQGVVATVRFRFAELRVAELLRDAQVENLQAQVAAYQYDRGWISQDAAALKGAGVAVADVPEPRTGGNAPGNQVGGQPDPGSERGVPDVIVRSNGHGQHIEA